MYSARLRIRIAWLLAGAAAALAGGATHAAAQSGDSTRATPAASSRALCFRGRPLAACRRYLVFDLTAASWVAGTSHGNGSCVPAGVCRRGDLGGYLAWDLGVMRNVDRTHAFGASAQIGGADPGGVRLALQARARVWLPHGFTFDAAAGPLMARRDLGGPGATRNTFGATGGVAFGVADLVSAVAAADVVNGAGRTSSAVYLGGRLSSYAGVVGSVAVAALAVAVAAALGGGLQL